MNETQFLTLKESDWINANIKIHQAFFFSQVKDGFVKDLILIWIGSLPLGFRGDPWAPPPTGLSVQGAQEAVDLGI